MKAEIKIFAAAAACLAAMSLPAQAVLIDHGVTYDLQVTSGLNTATATFNLHISGINGGADTEGGRFNVDDFAFTKPTNFLSASGPAGFITQDGGLNAGGCNGSGNFFCFNGPTPLGPALAANSVIDLAFSVTLSSGNFANWTPDLKLDWEGSKRGNYDNVSQLIGITPAVAVPGPAVGAGLPGLAIAFGGLLAWRRRKRKAAA
jgi:hypothetical protein